MNLPGVLPLFIGLTDGMSERARHKLIIQALTTAFGVAGVILFTGDIIFSTLGITVNDLRVGGGIILLVLSITDVIFGDYKRRAPSEDDDAANADTDTDLGIVPIGIPLTMGPAAITTILVNQSSFGYLPALSSLLLNLALVAIGYWFGPALIKKLGSNTAKAVAKVASLFLAAIAVAMIRTGVVGML